MRRLVPSAWRSSLAVAEPCSRKNSFTVPVARANASVDITTSSPSSIASPVSKRNRNACCLSESGASSFREGGSNGLAESAARIPAAAACKWGGKAGRCVVRRIAGPACENPCAQRSPISASNTSASGNDFSSTVRNSLSGRPGCSGCARCSASMASIAAWRKARHFSPSATHSPMAMAFRSAASNAMAREISAALKRDLTSKAEPETAPSRPNWD